MEFLGRTLVHSMWQCGLIAIALSGALAMTRRAGPAVRYALSLGALGLTVIIPVATAMVPSGWDPISTVAVSLDPALPWIAALWAIGVALFGLRLAGGLVRVHGLSRNGIAPASPGTLEFALRAARELGIRRAVRIVESCRVHVPVVLGIVRPMVLIPGALVSGMTPHQLHTLVAHELAHIRRYDVLVNLLQTLIETLLFFHPAVWWISSQVREEREKCCDDLAVRVCGRDVGAYAAALLALEEWRGQRPLLVAQASGTGGSLLRRVTRLMAPAPERVQLSAQWSVGVVVAACALVLIGERPDARELSAAKPLPAPVQVAPVVPMRNVARQVVSSTASGDAAMKVRLAARRLVDSTRSDGARERAARELAAYATAEALSALARAARTDDDRDVRRDAVQAIGAMQLAAAADTLVNLFRSADRRSTIVAVVEALGARSEPHVVEFLREVAQHSGDDDIRSEAIEALGSLPGSRGAAAIVEIALRDPRNESRRDAISEVPGVLPPPAAIDFLTALIERERGTDIAFAATEAMAEVRDPAAIRFLEELAVADTATKVRRRAIRSLADAALRSEAGAALLALARSHPEPALRREAIDALVELDEHGTVGDLMRFASTDPDSLVQRAAVTALGDVRPRATAIDSLAHVVRTHGRSTVRYAALRQLGDFDRDRKAGVVIAEIARTSDDPAVRARAEMMLRRN